MKSIILVLFIFLSNFIFGQNNYFVSTSGSDSNPGTLASPWRTIQYGADQLVAGDVLNILGGTYDEKVFVAVSGASGNSITIRNYNGQNVVIDASSVNTADPIIDITNRSFLIIDGLELENNIRLDAIGILVDGNCQDITVKNCKIHDIHFDSDPNASVNEFTNSQPLIVYGSSTTAMHNIIIDNNEIYDSRTGYSEALAINGNIDGFEVTNNLVHDITNIGIDIIGHEGTCSDPALDQARSGNVRYNTSHHCISPYATSGGIYVDGGKDIIIENNTSYHNGYGIEVGCENKNKTTSNITVRNNLFYDNEKAGLAFGGFDYPSETGKVINSYIYNNSFFKDDYSGDYNGEMIITYSEDCKIMNNIFYISSQNVVAYAENSSASLILDYNLYYGEAGANNFEFEWNGTSGSTWSAFKSATGQDGNSIFGNPKFASTILSSIDLHIASDSPAVEGGDPSYSSSVGEEDMDGGTRIIGAIIDCGGYEYSGTVPVEYLEEFQVYLDGDIIRMGWLVAHEINHSHFEIEKSKDLESWILVGSIESFESQSGKYQAIDSTPYSGTSYYRLKQIDNDNLYSYSKIIEVYKDDFVFEVYPNPASSIISIESKAGKRILISIFGQNGKFECKYILKDKTDIDISNWNEGVYFIRVGSQSKEFIIKR